MKPSQRDQRLRPAERVRRKAEFDRVFAAKCGVADDLFVVHAAANGLTWSRLGIGVSKKVLRNAAARNRLRRRVREVYRTSKHERPIGFDFICTARRGERDHARIAESLRGLLLRAAQKYSAREAEGKRRSPQGKAPT